MQALRKLTAGSSVKVYTNDGAIYGKLRRIDDDSECLYYNADSTMKNVVEICDDKGHVQQYYQGDIESGAIRIEPVPTSTVPFIDPAIVSVSKTSSELEKPFREVLTEFKPIQMGHIPPQKPEQLPSPNTEMPSPPAKDADVMAPVSSPHGAPRFSSRNRSNPKIVKVVEVDYRNPEKYAVFGKRSDSDTPASPPVAITNSVKTFKPDEKTASQDVSDTATPPKAPAASKSHNVPKSLIPPKARARAVCKQSPNTTVVSGKNTVLDSKQTSSTKTTEQSEALGARSPLVNDPAIVFMKASEPMDVKSAVNGHTTENKSPAGSQQRPKTQQQTKTQQPKELEPKKLKEVKAPKEERDQKNLTTTTNVVPNTNHEALQSNSGIKIIVGEKSYPCPLVSKEKIEKIVEKCVERSSCSRAMMAENAGRCASIIALKTLGPTQLENPSVVVLVGNNRIGSYGLAAARHLVNRGCNVSIFLAFDMSDIQEELSEQKKYAESAGVTLLTDIDPQTEPANLVIDASLIDELPAALRKPENRVVMEWAMSHNTMPVLSLDLPSGLQDDGYPFHMRFCFQPQVTVCFGAPREGLQGEYVSGDLYLADIGIPPAYWAEEGIRGLLQIPWGDHIVLQLEK